MGRHLWPSSNIPVSDMIPRVFHQIWLGRDVPNVVQQYRNEMASVYGAAGWSMRLWRDADVAELPDSCAQKMALCNHAIAASDVMRYYIIAQCGGVYIDVDIYPRADAPLLDESLSSDIDVFTTVPKGSLYTNNCLFGSVAGGRLLSEAAQYCVGGGATMPSSGSVFFGKLVYGFKTAYQHTIHHIKEDAHFIHNTNLSWEGSGVK